jgi:hypothetical protein
VLLLLWRCWLLWSNKCIGKNGLMLCIMPLVGLVWCSNSAVLLRRRRTLRFTSVQRQVGLVVELAHLTALALPKLLTSVQPS